MSRDSTPEEGNRNIEEHILGLCGHLLDMNSNVAVPAVTVGLSSRYIWYMHTIQQTMGYPFF